MRLVIDVSNNAIRRMLGAAALVGVVASAYFIGVARADGIPTGDTLFYSGLLEEDGAPVEGERSVLVELFDDASAGTLRCSTSAPTTAFAAGRFRVALGSACVTAIHTYPDLWAQVSIGALTLPRTKLGAVPYAVEAERATLADVASDADLLAGQPSSYYLGLANQTGTLSDSQLPSSAARRDASNTFTSSNTFNTAPSFAAAGAPFSVATSTKVTNLNADALDGLDSSSFASSSHAHAATDVTSGVLGYTRGGTGIGALTGNRLLGVNAGATGYELKSLSGTSGQVVVSHTPGNVILALAAGVPHACEYVSTSTATENTTVECPVGKKVVGGGGACAPSNDQATPTENRMKYTRPDSDRSGWQTICTVKDGSKSTYSYAICCAE